MDYGIDLRLRLDGGAELDIGSGDLSVLSGVENLRQALTLRLLVQVGELTELSHPRYGSRVHELIGEPMDRLNLDLLRRYVKKALSQDPRVREVVSVTATPRRDVPGAVDVEALVAPKGEGEAEPLPLRVEVALDVG